MLSLFFKLILRVLDILRLRFEPGLHISESSLHIPNEYNRNPEHTSSKPDSHHGLQ